MRCVTAVVLILTAPSAFAMDPEQAGREARQDLNALMEKQRSEKTSAVEKTADQAPPPRPSKADDNRATKSIDNRVPTICRGC